MNDLEVIGTLTEIMHKGERSCKFIISQGKAELLGTITFNRIELADSLEVGQAYKFRGNIAAFRRVKGDRTFVENTFYVMKVEPVGDVA